MEEEDELEILGNLLQREANGRDRDEPGDVEKKGENYDGENMSEYDEPGTPVKGSLLSNKP